MWANERNKNHWLFSKPHTVQIVDTNTALIKVCKDFDQRVGLLRCFYQDDNM